VTALCREELLLVPPLYSVFTDEFYDFEMPVTLCTCKYIAIIGTVLTQFQFVLQSVVLCDPRVQLKLKVKFYRIVIRSVMLYGA
jgi:hypothetical protein